MKQFLTFIFGVLSILIILAGALCAIQAIITGEAFIIICALLFGFIWAYLSVYWLRNNYPERLAAIAYNKLKKSK